MATEEFSFKSIVDSLSLPTLEEISIMTLAMQLMERKGVKKIYHQHFFHGRFKDHLPDSTVCKLTSTCKSLHLPDILLAKVVSCFHWIMEQYFNWIFFILTELKHVKKAFPEKKDYIAHVMSSVKWSMGVIHKEKSFYQLFLLENIEDDEIYDDITTIRSWYSLKDDMKIPEVTFNKLRDFNIEHVVPLVRKFLRQLRGCNRKQLDRYADKIYILLKEIEDESTLKEIFHEFFEVFLRISMLHWQWRKFFFTFIGIWADSIDKALLHDLITQSVEDVKMGKADIWEIKILWKKVPIEVKKSFCSAISYKKMKKAIDFLWPSSYKEDSSLWRNLPIEIFDMFLEDKELRNILTPYENFGILGCILTGRYDLVDFWLQKCLVSEEAIVSYFENCMQTKSVAFMHLFQSYPLSSVGEFLEWAFKYEDLMNTNEILKVKDKILNTNLIKFFDYAFHPWLSPTEWEDIKKILDWTLRNRNRKYENDFIDWKRKVIEDLFFRAPHTFSDDLKNSLCAFISYGLKNSEKIKVMMRKADLNEGYICSSFLKTDFARIDRYLRFLEGFGIDIFLTKKKIFYYIFNYPNEENFENEKYWINIRKLLYWNIDSNEETETKAEEIKKEIIIKFALECIQRCVDGNKYLWFAPRKKMALAKTWRRHELNLRVAMHNILEFLFERKTEDEEWSKMLFDLKIKVIEKLNDNSLGREETFDYDIVSLLIKWEEENENISKGHWDIKKYFIEWLKNNIGAKKIPKLISNTDFVSSLLKGDEKRPDFENMLWDLKEFLVSKVISDDDDVLTRQLLENVKGFSDFLNWNNLNDARILDLKIKILVRLLQIDTDKLRVFRLFVFRMSDFFNRCIRDNSSCDLKSNILNLKRCMLGMAVSTYSKNWDETYFKRLDKFLMLHSTGDEKDLKLMVIQEYGVRSCSQCLIDRNIIGLRAFIKWSEIEGKESNKDFKQNILLEILDAEYDNCWKDEQFWQDIHKFLSDNNYCGFVELADMKLDILEIYFLPLLGKLLAARNRVKLKLFLKCFFDRDTKLNECLPKTQKLIGEIFQKFGKDYCILMLMENDLDGVKDFWNLCFDSKIGIQINKLSLWNFKKDCVNQVLKKKMKKTVQGEHDWNSLPDDFWNCLNKFMTLSPDLSSLKGKIIEYKNFAAVKDAFLEMPKKFFKWLWFKNQEGGN